MTARRGSGESGRATLARATALAGLSFGLVQACALVRTIIVARLLTPADFGVAATLGLVVHFLDMASSLSVDRLLIQAPDGDDPKLQNAAHVIELVRGALAAGLIFLLAPLLAQAFGAPDAAGAFRWLALVPLLRGPLHLDSRRVQRDFRFRAAALSEGGAALATTLAVWPLSRVVAGYELLLWLLILQAGLALALSHAVAVRSYRLEWDASAAGRMLAFGWPLVVNGLLLFGISHGDRVVIGTAPRLFEQASYGLADLGLYSAAFTLVQAPTLLLVQVTNAIVLPLFSRALSDLELARRYALCSAALAVPTGAFAILFILCGGPLVEVIYGDAYAGAAAVVAALGAMQAVRIIRPAPTQAAIARADTRTPMLANALRSCALPAMGVTAAAGGALASIAACGLAGEVAAHLYSLVRVRRLHAVPLGAGLRPLFAAACAALAAAAASASLPTEAWLARGAAALAISMAGAALVLALSAPLRRFAVETGRALLSRLAPGAGAREGRP